MAVSTEEILARHHGRRDAILGLIGELVGFESKSGEEDLLNRLAAFVHGKLAALAENGNYGSEITVESLIEAGSGTHIRARFPFGRGGAFASGESGRAAGDGILVIGHLDTVWPTGTLARKPFGVTEDGRAIGPGIFDMKAGIAILIEALQTICDLGLETKRPVTVLLTCDEEVGSRKSRWLVEEEARRAAVALVLEPPLTGGIVKTGRKGIGTFTVRAIGRAAHAGLDPRNGVNAIVELGHQTIALAGLTDYERGVTINVGTISGGTGINVVPAEAEARVDLRFWDQGDGERMVEVIRDLQPCLAEARLEVTGGINRPAMPRSAANLALFAQAKSLAAEIGFELAERAVGGGSDGNFTAALGVPTLDGLGVDGAGAHAENEHIIVDDIPRRTTLLTRLLQTL